MVTCGIRLAGASKGAERIAAFRNLAFPANLKALEQYIGASSFLRHLISYYAKLIEPLQHRKVALLKEGREKGRTVTASENCFMSLIARPITSPTIIVSSAAATLDNSRLRSGNGGKGFPHLTAIYWPAPHGFAHGRPKLLSDL